jgi:hypothetical protein
MLHDNATNNNIFDQTSLILFIRFQLARCDYFRESRRMPVVTAIDRGGQKNIALPFCLFFDERPLLG